MNLNEEVEVLKGVPIFSKMELARLKLIAFTGERMTYSEGQELCHQGDPGDAMYVILGGVAEVLIDTPAGPIPVAELRKNNFVGETAILWDVPSTAHVEASEPVVTLKLAKHLLSTLAAENTRHAQAGTPRGRHQQEAGGVDGGE